MVLPEEIVITSNVSFAAKELGEALFQSTGRVPRYGGDGFPIRIHAEDGGSEAYRISIRENGIDIDGESVRAAVFGVYDFLETTLGCRFFAADCSYIPKVERIEIPIVVWAQSPAFDYREVYWRGALDGRFALQCRLNSARADIPDEWGGRTRFYNYSHTFDELVPPSVYFAEHPEYFSLVNGTRLGVKTQLCLTNPDVLALCIDGVRRWMREHPECAIFSVAQNDWYNSCACAQCRALDEKEGSGAGTMIWFVNQVADAIAEEFPKNFIHTFAYLYTRKAPRTLRPRPNVIVRLCPIETCFSHPLETCEFAVDGIDVEETSARTFKRAKNPFIHDLANWGKLCDHLYIWDYTTNFANYLQPFPNLNAMKANLLLYKQMGVTGVFEQGNYAPGQCSAFGALKIYLTAKLLWNPDTDMERHIEEFLVGYYGEAAVEPLREYLALLQLAAESAHMSLFDGAEVAYLDAETLDRGEALLSEAICNTADPARQERLERELLSPRYMKLVRSPLDAPNRDELIDAFAADVRRLGVTELFERRALKPSFACMKTSRYAGDRGSVPYSVYRL